MNLPEIVTKLKSDNDDTELADIRQKIEDAIGADEFAEFLERRRKARIRNIAITIGASVAVIGTTAWIVSKVVSSNEDENTDETDETETTTED